MKLEYNIDTLILHLRHIKKMCMENVNCVGCPFDIERNNWESKCMFAGSYFDEGVNPEEWDLEILERRDTKMPKHNPLFDKLGKIRTDIRILIWDIENLPVPQVKYQDYCLLNTAKEIMRETDLLIERVQEDVKNGR